MIKLLDFWAPWCIDPRTPVLTENGYMKASQIKVGMKLLTIDPKTKKAAYKKVQKLRIFKNAPSKKITLETERSLTGDVNHLVLTQDGFKKLAELNTGEKILVNPNSSLDASETRNKSVILAKVLGFVMTDGYLYEDLRHSIHETHFIVGIQEDAEEIKRDLLGLGFGKIEIKKRANKRMIDGREFTITTYRCRFFSKSLFELLKSLGAPVGRKKNQAYFIPEWIMNNNKATKRAFLRGWLGGDGCKINYFIKHGGTSSHDAGFKINAIELHKEKELEKEGILYAKQLGLLFEELGIEVKEISSIDDEDGVIISLRLATDYLSLLNLTKVGYAYASTKNANVPFIGEFISYRIFERNRYVEAKKYVLEQLALGVSNSQLAQSLQIPLNTVVSWRYSNRDTTIVYPPKDGEARFDLWLQDRQQGDLLWERVKVIEDVENRDVIGITVGDPHTIVTNGIVSHNCGPCKMMNPVIEELEKELKGTVEIVKINVDEQQEQASKYGVMSIPTYVVLKDGQEVGRKIGVTSKADLVSLLNV